MAAGISDLVASQGSSYAVIVATADWHDDPGTHFSDHPDYVDTWPPHCRVGTSGADFHPAVLPAVSRATAVFRKGQFVAANQYYARYDRDESFILWWRFHQTDDVRTGWQRADVKLKPEQKP